MTSLIGSKNKKNTIGRYSQLTPHLIHQKRGFTFFEVMVTAAILATGIVLIYKSLYLTLDYQAHLTNRLHAAHLTENKLEELQRIYYDTGEVASNSRESIVAFLNNKRVEYQMNVVTNNVGGLRDILDVQVTLTWLENKKFRSLKRDGYILTSPSQ